MPCQHEHCACNLTLKCVLGLACAMWQSYLVQLLHASDLMKSLYDDNQNLS